MGENKDKLEELLKEFEVYGDLDGIQDIRPYMKALENLIKGYRELEEENSKIRDANSKLYEVAQGRAVQEILSDSYIPKSKIKEKIEEVNKSLGYSPVNKILIEQVLQELMEE